MENSHKIAIGHMVTSAGQSLLGGFQAREHRRRPLHHSCERVVFVKGNVLGGYRLGNKYEELAEK